MKHLFLFTIGPVQSFIAQARKTQDLYAGSQILSKLVKAGIKEIPNWEEKIIFPILDKKDENQSLPNRFIAIVETPEKELKQLGIDIEKKVRTAFKTIAEKALTKETNNRKDGFDELFSDQINRHLDIHWAFHPLDDNNYSTSYKEIEALLGSIKNVRPFEQFGNGDGEAGRKCSLDGENNALFFGRKKPSLAIKQQRQNAIKLHGFLTEEKEGLSAVSFVKRYSDSRRFPSTAEVTVKHDEEKLKDAPKKKEIFECYKKLFSNEADAIEVCTKMISNGWVQNINIKELSNEDEWNNHFDYQPLFDENLREKAIPHKEQLRLAQILQGKLASSFKTKYYALIMFDGDKMGERLSKANKHEEHKDFSISLAQFAKAARGIVDEHGQTVYAGGDDFLGFVNLHYLFKVMTDLRKAFDENINIGESKKLTFSAGIVIAHYKMPLAEVLKTVRQVEKKAKNDGDRNAFCITAMKHSGEIQETVFKWGTKNNENENWEAIRYITEQLISGTFSNKFITNLTVELYQLAGIKLDRISISSDAVTTEFKRLVKRALIERSDSITNEKNINTLVEKLEILYKNSRKSNERVKNFIHALQITDFLSRKIN